MLLNLKTEIARNKLSAARIAPKIGISENAMSKKILEKTHFTRPEMYAIAKHFPGVSMEYLFASDKE